MPLADCPAFAKLLLLMEFPSELARLSSTLFSWSAYDPTAKTDLFSSAVTTADGTYVVDPIPLSDIDIAEILAAAPIAGIVVTNANHHRAAVEYSDKFSVPIFAHAKSFAGQQPRRFVEVKAGEKVGDSLEVIRLDGAVAGEIAIYDARNGGTLVVGDALINFDPYGFTFLPRKYCQNEKQMRQSLTKLLEFEVERMLFAHGEPILKSAGEKLRRLLKSSSDR
jgi:hypothetical protein